MLEEVRLLTNLETAKQKLLQIILIGQPELRELLARNDLRQLAQRVTGRYHLQPLTHDESDQYINHRLRVAGALVEIFDSAARREVYRLSGGVPRLINVICDRALLGAYSRGVRTVDNKLVREAASEVSGEKIQTRALRWLYPIIGVTAAILVVLGGLTILEDRQPQQLAAAPAELRTVQEEVVSEPVTVAEPEPVEAIIIDIPSGPSLEEVLLEKQTMTGTDSAMTTLFQQWGMGYDPTKGTACEQAAASGLSCLFQRGTWNVIRQLDRPAILNLTDTEGYEHQVVLTRINEDSGEFVIGDLTGDFSLAEIARLWYGEYLLLWRPPNGSPSALRVGMRGNGIVWLRDSLARFDPTFASASTDPEYFDQQLEENLKSFQRRNRLKVDGLAGQQTQIILNSGLGLENTPRLVQ